MIYITLGDPYSINIEHIYKQLTKRNLDSAVTIVGSYWHWQHQLEMLNFSQLKFCVVKDILNLQKNALTFVDIGNTDLSKPANELSKVELGKISVESLNMLKKVEFCKNDVVITAPIDKYACTSYGFKYPGQTEFFQDLWGGEGVMILAGDRLKVGLITNHLAISEVTKFISTELIENKITLFHQSLKNIYGFENPRIAVCGLNPHCGDHGMFGSEDDLLVLPVVESLKNKITVSGPLPADTIFWKMLQGEFDGVLAMYHDQGLGPLKTIHFDDAVNITGGLEFLRISPDHGPARDLYLTENSSPSSFSKAFDIAIKNI